LQYLCGFCQEIFEVEDDLDSHILNVHNISIGKENDDQNQEEGGCSEKEVSVKEEYDESIKVEKQEDLDTLNELELPAPNSNLVEENEKTVVKKESKYANMFTHDSKKDRWSCNNCTAKYTSVDAVKRHLKKSMCTSSEEYNYKPKRNWTLLYTRINSNWTCNNCGSSFKAERLMHRHLQKTECGRLKSETIKLMYTQTGDSFQCDNCKEQYMSVNEVEAHINDDKCYGRDMKSANIVPRQKYDYTNLYIREKDKWTCLGCMVEYKSDHGIKSHLQTTVCGFGEKIREAPRVRKDYTNLYDRDGDLWTCKSCKFEYKSDRGIYSHLQTTNCGFGVKSREAPRNKYSNMYTKDEMGFRHCNFCSKKFVSERGVYYHLNKSSCTKDNLNDEKNGVEEFKEEKPLNVGQRFNFEQFCSEYSMVQNLLNFNMNRALKSPTDIGDTNYEYIPID